MAFMDVMQKSRKDPHSAGRLLRDSGVPAQMVPLAITTMWWTPAEIDPDAQATQVVIFAAQKRLATLGYQVRPSGIMDPHTEGALTRVVGRNWPSTAWVNIFALLRKERQSDMGYVGVGYTSDLGAYYGPMGDVTSDVKALQAAVGISARDIAAANGSVGPKTQAAVVTVVKAARSTIFDPDMAKVADQVLKATSLTRAAVIKNNAATLTIIALGRQGQQAAAAVVRAGADLIVDPFSGKSITRTDAKKARSKAGAPEGAAAPPEAPPAPDGAKPSLFDRIMAPKIFGIPVAPVAAVGLIGLVAFATRKRGGGSSAMKPLTGPTIAAAITPTQNPGRRRRRRAGGRR